jgi:large subunit ribosomal protein L9
MLGKSIVALTRPRAVAGFQAIRCGSSIPVILIDNVENWGNAGEIVKVKRGYARNYLVPKAKAVYLTDSNREKHAQLMETAKKGAARGSSSSSSSNSKYIAALNLLTEPLNITMKTVGETDALYASVTSANIVALLAAEQGIEVATSSVTMAAKIESSGLHTVSVLGVDVHIQVTAEAAETAATA